MSDFKVKMHQNPKFGWSSTPDPLAGFKGPILLREGRGVEGMGGDGGGQGREVLWSPKNP